MLRLYLYARVRIYHHLLHTGPRVQQAPGIPCALFFGRNGWQSPGETRRGNIYGCRRPALTGRSSIPETAAIEPMGRGVLDTRLRGYDVGVWGEILRCALAHRSSLRAPE
jgi:hypothetical protein